MIIFFTFSQLVELGYKSFELNLRVEASLDSDMPRWKKKTNKVDTYTVHFINYHKKIVLAYFK